MFKSASIALLVLAAASPQSIAAAQTSTTNVTGRVVDAATGEPIAGARVTLGFAPTGPRAATPPVFNRPLTTETSAEGVFVIRGASPGRWRVQVQKTGFSLLGGNARAPFIDVGAANVTVPEIRLDRGGAVAGRVVDARGNPMGGLPVTARQHVRQPNGFIGPGGNSVTGETNDLGEFRLAGLPPGEYHVVVRPRPIPMIAAAATPSRTAFVQTFYPGVADLAGAVPVTVTRGLTTSGLDFQMLAEAAYQVSGLAVDASGRPAPGAIVQLVPAVGTPAASTLRATAEPDGSFRIVNVPQGTYRIQAAVPVVVRTATGSSTSVSFGAPGRGADVAEIVVTGANVSGIQVVAQRPTARP
jgi:hypothetical protein